jgi:hypothetical protein
MRRITDPAQLQAYRLSYVTSACRATAQHHKCTKGDAEAWTWTHNGTPYAVGFLGRSQHPFSSRNGGRGSVFRFHNDAQRREWVAHLFAVAMRVDSARAERRANAKERRAAGHRLNVGDVLRASWGYDQTNVDFYQVTARIGVTMVEVRPIGQQREETGSMSGTCTPIVDAFKGAPQRCRVSVQGDGVTIDSVRRAYRMEPTATIAGVKVFAPSSWSSYA